MAQLLWRVILLLLLHLSTAQVFVVPPSSDSSDAQSANYSISKPLNAEWDCDFASVNLVLVSEHRASDGTQWNKTILTNVSNSNNAVVHFGTRIPLSDGAQFHLEVDEVDPDTGNATGSYFDSAVFSLSSSTSTAKNTSTSTPTSTSTSSASPATSSATTGGMFPSHMSQGSIIGAGVGLIGTVVIVAIAITWGIRYRNKRRRQRYLDAESTHSVVGIAVAGAMQEPFPADPRSPETISALYAPTGGDRATWSKRWSHLAETRRLSVWSPSTESSAISPLSEWSEQSRRDDHQPPTPPPKTWTQLGWR